jgi:NAD(P)-dependent dehydrogenase (short-subunit alcohol dehydrogenase family)
MGVPKIFVDTVRAHGGFAMELSGTKIVVIGGTSGIGRAVAARCAALGAEVVVASSSQEKVDAARVELPADVVADVVDVTDERQVAAFFDQVGSLDHLVYTAGDWGPMGGARLRELDLERAGDVFAVRFWGALAAAKHAHLSMPAGGSITLTDGLIAHRPRPGAAVNTAMAGAVEHLVTGLAVELAPVRVNAVCPGLIATDALARIPPERITTMTARQAVPRAGSPDEAAEAYLYLIRGTYTTGQVLRVDGGMSLT